MADLQETIGRVIRQERQGLHLTIKELGDKAGLSEIYVGEIERGQKYPSGKVLESLVQALNIELAEFFVLLAEELRREHEPQFTSVIGFTLPNTPGQPRRTTIKRIVNMLGDGDNEVEKVISIGNFFFSRDLTPV